MAASAPPLVNEHRPLDGLVRQGPDGGRQLASGRCLPGGSHVGQDRPGTVQVAQRVSKTDVASHE
eukprot:3739464-Alexandrium_andersonii.AAC.1